MEMYVKMCTSCTNKDIYIYSARHPPCYSDTVYPHVFIIPIILIDTSTNPDCLHITIFTNLYNYEVTRASRS